MANSKRAEIKRTLAYSLNNLLSASDKIEKTFLLVDESHPKIIKGLHAADEIIGMAYKQIQAIHEII